MAQSEARLNQNLINTINQNTIEAPVRVYVGLNNSSVALIRVAINQWMRDKSSRFKNTKARIEIARDLVERMDEILGFRKENLNG
jgi:hypothetical protein